MYGSVKLLLDVYRCVHIIVSEQMCTGENRVNLCVINLANRVSLKIFSLKFYAKSTTKMLKFHLFYGF